MEGPAGVVEAGPPGDIGQQQKVGDRMEATMGQGAGQEVKTNLRRRVGYIGIRVGEATHSGPSCAAHMPGGWLKEAVRKKTFFEGLRGARTHVEKRFHAL